MTARLIEDHPEFDATDGAHPAWWRGHDHAAAKFIELKLRLEASLADVKELDRWRNVWGRSVTCFRDTKGRDVYVLKAGSASTDPNNPNYVEPLYETFMGETPEEARRAAAAWVRLNPEKARS